MYVLVSRKCGLVGVCVCCVGIKEVWTVGCMCVLCWYLVDWWVYVHVVLVSKEVWAGGCRCVLCW